MEELTRAEERIMNCIWKFEKSVKTSDIMKLLKEDYGKEYVNTTLCVFMSSLRKKEYLRYQKKGNSYVYTPLISKEDYQREQMRIFLDGCFGGSLIHMLQAAVRNAGVEELKQIETLLEDKIKEKEASG